jgi:heme oxygenase
MQSLLLWASQRLFSNEQAFHSLSLDMYQGTRDIHTQVEQHPFVRRLLKDTLDSASYQQYLVDLNLVYSVLEEEIASNLKTESELNKIYFPELNRTTMLDADLNSSSFKDLPRNTSEAALSYAEHLSLLGRQEPILLAAHAYVRYLGDLSGGMILKRHIEKKWPDAIHFYDFSKLFKAYDESNPMAFKDFYKERLNSLVVNEHMRQRLIQEAHLAFEYAEKMFNAIPSLKPAAL